MDKQALAMAVFMGLYVPLFTGISVTIHRFTRRKPQQSNKIIIVHRQFENQSFDTVNENLIFNLDKPHKLFSKDVSEIKTFSFYKFLPPAYIRDNNLLRNIDLDKFVIDESQINWHTISQRHD
ncbi:putative glycosyl transferase [Calothrix parasitica NIES-267]|uniref:Putative glycosyl transferase n=1 Tax=Calothrix parasitica NIES-267 TaxID=1973488 RepID=A0A1Z4LRV5_9CYAN|nr:putative glycosyl transferase [Calothrix parasitica NIES-267]